MNSSVVIKSYTKGLSIHLDPEADIEVIKTDLAARFSESASFFRDATMAISFEDREIDSATERELVNIITSNSQVKVACIAGKNKFTQQLITNALNQIEYKSEVEKNVVQVFNGSLKDGKVMEVPGSVLILGDVYPDTTVIATGDIFVMGGLYGQAYAGNAGDTEKIIAALDLNPEKLRIAGIKYKPAEKPKWVIKNKQVPVPRAARLNGTDVIMEPINREFWNTLIRETDRVLV